MKRVDLDETQIQLMLNLAAHVEGRDVRLSDRDRDALANLKRSLLAALDKADGRIANENTSADTPSEP
jgi:hypothetical protein